MNPILSDLTIATATFEARHTLERRQRIALARAARPAGREGLLVRLASAIRQVIDPRGYALSQVRPVEQPAAAAPAPAPRLAPVHELPLATTDPSTRRAA